MYQRDGSEPERVRFRDFSQLGIEGSIAHDLCVDMAVDNPDRYSNIGIWASLMVEAAQGIDSPYPVDVEELQRYLHGSLFPGQTWRDANPIAHNFVATFNDNAVADTAYRQVVLPEPDAYGETIVDQPYRRWKYPDRTVADYVAARIEYDDLGQQARDLIRAANACPSDADVNGLVDSCSALQELARRRNELKEGPTDDYVGYHGNSRHRRRRWSGWDDPAGTWPDLDLANFVLTEPALDKSLGDLVDRTTAELDTLTAINAVGEPGEDHRFRYGAKGANLLRLEAVLEQLRAMGSPVAESIKIPPFMTIDTDVHRQYQAGAGIPDTVQSVQAWIEQAGSETAYLLRSSAVFSEDGEHTGAGVYDSVMLQPPISASDILTGLEQVYASTDSALALSYRQGIGVPEESMGIVVQQAGTNFYGGYYLVTLNTMMPGAPNLADYTLVEGDHPLDTRYEGQEPSSISRVLHLDRQGLFLNYGVDTARSDETAARFHTPPDTDKHTPADSWSAAQAGVLAERLFGRPVQIEGLIGDDNVFEFVQARPLPDHMLKTTPFDGFPDYNEDEELWFQGRGLGVINGARAIVTNEMGLGGRHLWSQYSTNDTGGQEVDLSAGQPLDLFVWHSSYGQGRNVNGDLAERLMSLSPTQRDRIICLIQESPGRGGSGFGHLETFFGEIGLRTIFFDRHSYTPTKKLLTGQEVSVYSDGYKAVVLSSQTDPVYAAYIAERNQPVWHSDDDPDGDA